MYSFQFDLLCNDLFYNINKYDVLCIRNKFLPKFFGADFTLILSNSHRHPY